VSAIARERFLVTGCAGFIGGHLLRRLIGEGLEVVGVDNFATGLRENIEDLSGKFDFIEGDLCDPEIAAKACRGVTHILHQAAIPSVPRSLKDPLASLHASATATVTLLEAARKEGVRRLVQAGSSSAYGDSKTLPKVETMTPRPMSPYAVSKLAQEQFAFAYAKCFGIDTATFRYFNVFGPRQNPNSAYAAVIPKFITMLMAGKQPTIDGDGLQSRDFTYIDNVVEANLLAARHPEPLQGETFNVACGQRTTLLELMDLLNEFLGTDIKSLHTESRAGDVKHSQACIEKISATLGYKPVVLFREGVRRTVEYFKNRAVNAIG